MASSQNGSLGPACPAPRDSNAEEAEAVAATKPTIVVSRHRSNIIECVSQQQSTRKSISVKPS